MNKNKVLPPFKIIKKHRKNIPNYSSERNLKEFLVETHNLMKILFNIWEEYSSEKLSESFYLDSLSGI